MDNVFRLKTDNPYNLRQAYEFSRPIVAFKKEKPLERRLKSGNLIIVHVGYVRFILKV